MKILTIDEKQIGNKQEPYIIAEIGFNHGGNLRLAKDMIYEAAGCGVDAVKFQTYQAEDIALIESEHFQTIQSGELSLQDHKELVSFAKECGVTFLSTPFSKWAVDLLEEVDVAAYKIASMDLVNHELLEYVAKKQKPIILSTGMSTVKEIRDAIETITQTGNDKIALLHCISKYPVLTEDANLNMITKLKSYFKFPIGFSDHTLGSIAPLIAIALGADIIEKHFTTDKKYPGPDHKISADQEEMTAIVSGAKEVTSILGSATIGLKRPDRTNAVFYRRSIHASIDISKGTVIDEEMVKYVRPGDGVSIREKNNIEWETMIKAGDVS